jgi:glycine oxidase
MTTPVSSFDTAIIGGGVIGCSIAWRLAQAGQRVVVIERGAIGQEASWAAGGMLAPLAEADGIDAFFELCVASRALYADFARELREASGIDIEYRTEGTLYLALTDEDEAELEHRWQWQHAAGLNIKKLNAECVRKLEPLVTDKLRWALKFPDDHQVDNRRLVKALELAARKAGVVFQPRTEVLSVEIANAHVTGVLTSRERLAASTVILAAGSWSTTISLQTGPLQADRLSHLVKVNPVRGQMAAFEMPEPPLQHVVYARDAYLIPRLSGYVIAGSTTEDAGYDKRNTAGGIASIIQRACTLAPALAAQPLVETWAGLRPKAADEWPVLGPDAEVQGLIYATGHYRNGILLTPITAKVISELVLGDTLSIDLAPVSLTRFELQRS